MMDHTRLLVQNILMHPREFEWSVQGLGMLRTYLSQEVRLHIWDSSLKVAGASPYHDHPWDLDSLIVAGRYKQHRYGVPQPNDTWTPRQKFNSATILCGEAAQTVAETVELELVEMPLEIYSDGMMYSQKSEEIHLSCPEDGTVTIVKRTFKADRDHALVLWRGKGGWQSAKPRTATQEEVIDVTQRSLAMWF